MYQDYLNFIGLYSPLILAHVVVPTLASVRQEEESFWFLSLPLSQKILLRHFVYSRDGMRKGRWWTSFTYMFLHADRPHLFCNLQGLITAGPAVVEVLGPWGTLVTYVAAGVAGALDVPRLYDLQLERFLGAQWRWLRKSTDLSSFLGLNTKDEAAFFFQSPFLRSAQLSIFEAIESGVAALDYAAGRMAKSVAADVSSSRRLIGASAGVSAFLAVDFCVGILRCYENIFTRPKQNRHDKDSSIVLVQASLHVLCALRFFLAEASRAWSGSLTGVDHAAHLNGAICGFTAFFIAQSILRWRRKRRSIKSYIHNVVLKRAHFYGTTKEALLNLNNNKSDDGDSPSPSGSELEKKNRI